ncbi:hypothetical protein BKA69DRAFT_1069135 [Paraphysoderma sedebokerense]|nr:hypothetical protein BKA69DRAFT_1069135 [Paraphysoderma sedebokerense]
MYLLSFWTLVFLLSSAVDVRTLPTLGDQASVENFSQPQSIQRAENDHCFESVGHDPTTTSMNCNSEYKLIGYHGTCSKHKDSIEAAIKISDDLDTNYAQPQLGSSRFYIADSAEVAYSFGLQACSNTLNSVLEIIPHITVCRIYVDRKVLPQIPKVYIPMQMKSQSDKKEDEIVWFDESKITSWEKYATPEEGRSKVRFSKIYTGDDEPTLLNIHIIGALQSAWPRSYLKYLKGKCKTMSQEKAKSLRTIPYSDILTRRSKGWGDIAAANLYRPVVLVPLGDADEEYAYMYRNED